MVLKNVKHSGNKKNIFLSNSGPGNSVYSNVNSLFGDDENVGMTGIHNGSLLSLAATIPKAKHINTGAVFGSPDFTMNDNEIVLPLHLSISLEKKSWAQVILAASTSHDHSAKTDSDPFSIVDMNSDGKYLSFTLLNSFLDVRLSTLEHFLELLSNQVLDIVKWLNGIALVPLAPISEQSPLISVFQSLIPVLSVVVNSSVDLDMVLDIPDACPVLFSSAADDVLVLSSSSTRVLTFKVDSLKSKLVALKVSVGSVLEKLDLLCASSGFQKSSLSQ
ncbi:hypothetical protein G9A89_017027 [Geosiphon pyriformis]|nr:hypothetical protein G9A89_017027 [Geosiphon pyriformis]